MRRIPVLAIAIVAVAAFACTDPPVDSAAKPAAENPLAPSFSATIDAPAPPSSICTAYEQDLAALTERQAAEPSEELAAEVAALEAITADVCN